MDSPAACASCALPTTDNSNHSSAGRYIHTTQTDTRRRHIPRYHRMLGRRIKVNRRISLILTLKSVAMATILDRSKKEGQILNGRSNIYRMVKIGTVDLEIMIICQLSQKILNEGLYTFKPFKLRGYRTKFHQICTRCSQVITDELF